ncbi:MULTISPECIES: SDR family oxidoreductase [unclassified Brevundimonas]|uniref:SDR family oxidoreductase n=1 Tax=unclassified Brevundimonas TaxID=2622653 RepID=UPI0025C4D832|nr:MULTISPECIES: SDR family oxidoreductase [unclassified Brevundimonas]
MTGKVVLITGAARRVGAALAEGLATEGWTIAVHHRSGADEARALCQRISEAGGQAKAFAADLSDAHQRNGLISAVVARFGRIDALINNASLFEYDDLSSLTDERWEAHLSANLTAPMFLIRDFAKAVESQGGDGAVVNILDHKLNAANPDFLSYTAGKASLGALTQTLALALAPRVRLNGVSPGLILRSGDQTQAEYEKAWADTPLGRGTSLDDMLAAVRFALTTRGMTGQIITVDGGESLSPRGRDVAFDPSLKD